MKLYALLIIGVGLAASTRATAQPAAMLGRPVPAASADSACSSIIQATARGVAPDPLIGEYIPAARLGPISDVRFGPDSAPEAATGTPEERFNWGIPDPLRTPSPATAGSSQSHFGDKLGEMFDSNSKGHDFFHFESDHCFDTFISPVSNPFLNEDPRTLTELRPIVMFQTIPSSNSLYHGGNVWWYGIQGRLAIFDRFSIVLNKLGGISIDPGSGSPASGQTSFSEIWIGPKYTWYRDDQTGTIAATGLIFQTATGKDVYQNTGGLSLAPYANIAQKFGKSSYGSFNVMDTLGFSFATSAARSNYVYDSLHVDFDVLNYNKIFPLIELNWLQYIRDGDARSVGFEGQDLMNVGSTPYTHDLMTIAFGGRYKIWEEKMQTGLAASFPLWGGHGDLQSFRLTVDFIWRY